LLRCGEFYGKVGIEGDILGKIGVSVEIEQLWLIRLEKVGFSLKYAPLFIYKITILLKKYVFRYRCVIVALSPKGTPDGRGTA